MSRALRLAALLAVLATSVLASEPWDDKAFAAAPGALIAAAERVPAGDSATVTLLDEGHYTLESDGRTRTITHRMIRIVDESAIEYEGTVTIPWAPWYYDRPTITARVVTKDGTVHQLDQKAITEAPARDEWDIFSDNRLLRAPLPAVAVGSVIEYVIAWDGKNPIAGAGSTETFMLGEAVPVERTRLTIDAPPSLAVKMINKSTLQPKVEEKDGRRVTVFESGRIEARKNIEGFLPFDQSYAPYIAFSTGSSWGNLAQKYGEIVDKQIAGSDLTKFVRDAIGTATDRKEVVARALAAIQKNVRYAGVEVGESSVVPRAPKVVLSNKYGDCKDKATLLVAMLRQAGIPAHVALLSSGTYMDVIPELPGLGEFNHAIVYVGGGAPMWVDPTDEFARAGELPAEDQGRMALVAAPETTELLRTPETPSAENRYTETRTYTLPEEGKARVLEITETTNGAEDAYQRRYYAGSDRTKYREQIESYVKSYYLAKKLDKIDASDPHDLGKPFRITIEASEAETGVVHHGDGAISLHPNNLLSWLPYPLRETDEQRKNDPDSHPRQNDFIFPSPSTHEWTYRIIPPVGYKARTLPENETRKLGTTTFTRQFVAQDDGTVVATLRFESGKRRITAAELEETRVAITKLLEEKSTFIGFDLIGQAKLNGGDVAGALAEFRKLAELHPKESQHHIEIARALLVGGLGEAARAEVRRAVAMEPKNAKAHLALAGIFEYDLLGRLLRKGFDMPTAITSLKKAKELDPKDVEVRSALAKLLTYGSDGMEFGRDARLEEAIAEYRATRKELPDETKSFDADLMMALAFAGRFAEMKELAKTMEEGAQRETGRITAIAATDGVAAALKELGAYDVNTRRSHAANVGQMLMKLRLYPQAADVLESAMQGAPNASQARPFVEALRKTKRLEDVSIPADDPRSVMRELLLGMAQNDVARVKAVLAPDLTKDEETFDPLNVMRWYGGGEMPPPVLADLGWALARVQSDGNEATGFRVRLRSDGAPMAAQNMFVLKEGGHYVVRAAAAQQPLVGLAALRFVDAGELDRARVWLNWLREDVSAGGGGDDPLHGSPFAALWPKENPNANADEIRLAAASLMVGVGEDKPLPILTAAREKASTDQTKLWIDGAIAIVAADRKQWPIVVAAGERLIKAYPDSETAFTTYATGLIQAGKAAEAEALAKKRLEKLPRDAQALRMLTNAAASTHDYAAAAKYAEQIVDQLSPTPADFNNAAWFELFAGNLDHALENARRATNDNNANSAAALHTLATLYAETGKNVEAYDALLRTLDRAHREQPASSDWYVLGRMAENYGVTDAALAAYKRVENKEDSGGSVWELAQKRLAVLAAVKR